MTTFFGAIADDFTGASDLAALLSRSGVEVRLRLGVPDEAAEDTAAFEIIALKSRTCAIDEAVNDSLAALAWLKDAGAQRFFFKYCSTFDSTNQGNIGPVAEALMEALNTNQTIYCPAFPENGRTIFMGHLFVGQQPLAESPMKDHPLTPMRDSNLMRLLDRQTKLSVGLADRLIVAKGSESLKAHLQAAAETDKGHMIIDAVANSDLDIIASACHDMPLLTGGSALTMPLPDLYRSQGFIAADYYQITIPDLPPAAIILSGSCSSMTRQQVEHYQGPSFKLDPLELAQKGPVAAKEWLATQDFAQAPLIYATSAPEEVKEIQDKLGVAKAGQIIEQTLSELACEAYNINVRRFIIAGGETSGAVAKALKIDNLLIGDEITAGVPWCFAQTQTDPFAITIKSGNFGTADFFYEALQRLS